MEEVAHIVHIWIVFVIKQGEPWSRKKDNWFDLEASIMLFYSSVILLEFQNFLKAPYSFLYVQTCYVGVAAALDPLFLHGCLLFFLLDNCPF